MKRSLAFDVRFVPENAFRWNGAGFLRIDARGISFALKRGLWTLLGRPRIRHIAAAKLTGVWREGEALRVEYTADDATPATVPFRARDRDTAARIVQALPTLRTVELESETRPAVRRVLRVDWRVVGVLAFVLGVLAGGLLMLQRNPEPAVAGVAPPAQPAGVGARPGATPADASRQTEARQSRIRRPDIPPATTTAPDEGFSPTTFGEVIATPANEAESDPVTTDFDTEGAERKSARARLAARISSRSVPTRQYSIEPFMAGTVEHQVALGAYTQFELVSATLQQQLSEARPWPGYLAVDALDQIEVRWWSQTFRMLDNEDLAAFGLRDFRGALLAAARHHRNSATLLAESNRSGNTVLSILSLYEITRARQSQQLAKRYLD